MRLFKNLLLLAVLIFDLYFLINIGRPIYLREIFENRLVFWIYISVNTYFLGLLLPHLLKIFKSKI